MVDPVKHKNFSLDIDTAEKLIKWSEKEMRSPAMQLRWLIIKHLPSTLKDLPVVKEPVVKKELTPTTVLPTLKGTERTRAAVVSFHNNRRQSKKVCVDEDGWQRKRQKRGQARYARQPLRASSLMYRVLFILGEYGEDLSNFELAELDGQNHFDSYAKVTSDAWSGGLLERRSTLNQDSRGYFTFRLAPYGKKILEKTRREEESED